MTKPTADDFMLSYEIITDALSRAIKPSDDDVGVLIRAAKAYIHLLNAITVINAHHNLHDAVDDVRRLLPDTELKGFEGSTWRHPAVVQCGSAASEISRHIAAASPKPKHRKRR